MQRGCELDLMRLAGVYSTRARRAKRAGDCVFAAVCVGAGEEFERRCEAVAERLQQGALREIKQV
jgi:hypothetical protein